MGLRAHAFEQKVVERLERSGTLPAPEHQAAQNIDASRTEVSRQIKFGPAGWAVTDTEY
mgnify:FL=1